LTTSYHRGAVLGYEYATEEEARSAAGELNRRFTERELAGLRVYRIRWNNDYLVEAVFDRNVAENRVEDAKALLGESGAPIHPDDLEDYRRATRRREESGVLGWLRRIIEP
jgi:hypothetical protein